MIKGTGRGLSPLTGGAKGGAKGKTMGRGGQGEDRVRTGWIVFCKTHSASYSIRMVGAGSPAYLHLVNDLRGKEGLRCIFNVCKAYLNIHVWVNAAWQCAKPGRRRECAELKGTANSS